MSKKSEIRQKAVEVLGRPEYREGIRFATLIKIVIEETGENSNTCNGSLYNFPNEEPQVVSRPHRGLFILKANESLVEGSLSIPSTETVSSKYSESDIYEPVRNYLLAQQECTHAIVLGGSMFGKKWGTPDVVGAIRAPSDSVYKPILEIIAVEIKDPGYSPVEALGQAMSYKYFSHRTWLVLPEDNEIDRIEGIAISANIGLISFIHQNNNFNFTILNRPVQGNPDFFEVNKILDQLKEKDKKKYNDLIKNEND
jgi:hypothetical protein